MLQLVPLHASARVPALEIPTAVHDDGDGHATLASSTLLACGGLGEAWMVHLVPFHCSIRLLPDGVKAWEAPTAVHAEADAQDTPLRKLPGAGLGVAWMVHRLPFHRSARVAAGVLPTAVQAVADVQDTAFSEPPCGSFGVVWILQREPSHRSASTLAAPALVRLDPTAMHAEAEEHATPRGPLNITPGGVGIGRMRHAVPFHCSARLTPAPDALM